MLDSINLNDRTYTELLEEALSQIPLYSDEWTNFNPSDPGLTILQNLTAFNILQQEKLNEVTDAVRCKLLALLGFEPEKARAAEIPVALPAAEKRALCRFQKFVSQDIIFEADADESCERWGIEAVYRERDGRYSDVSALLDSGLNMSVAPFGKPARAGDALCLILSGAPDFKKELTLYADVLGEERRNPFAEGETEVPARPVWQIYTKSGWCDISFSDGTHGFLTGGLITLRAAEAEPAIFREAPHAGYALRCALTAHEYDMTPMLTALYAISTRLVQRDTRAALRVTAGCDRFSFRFDEVSYPFLRVYARERAGEPYRAYELAPPDAEKGRFFETEKDADGIRTIRFDAARYGFHPAAGADNLALAFCTAGAERERALGPVYGYVDQEMAVTDEAGDILRDAFVLMLETQSPDGEKGYGFVRPGEADESGFLYDLARDANRIRVKNPEVGRSCRAFTAACALTFGDAGNVRAGNAFQVFAGEDADAPEEVTAFVNPAPGRGGARAETLSALRTRFSVAMKSPKAAVTAEDYERIVLSAPGLCVHKARALPAPDENLVRVVVKPHGETAFPMLSESYVRRLSERLSERRLLGAAFELVQPRYVPIDAHGVVCVRSRFVNARADIEAAIRRVLDHVSSEKNFGEPVVFNEVFEAVATLPCVLAILDLTLTPGLRGHTVMKGLDILPEGRCLCYPGSVSVELHTRTGQ